MATKISPNILNHYCWPHDVLFDSDGSAKHPAEASILFITPPPITTIALRPLGSKPISILMNGFVEGIYEEDNDGE